MGLGATIKVGMDSSAVKRGMATLKSSFARFGGILKGVGNLMRKSLVPVVGALAGVGYAMKQVIDAGSELHDMSMQTGVAVGKLAELQHVLALAGVPMRDTSKMLSVLSSNLYEAGTEAGTAREALNDLGLRAGDLAGLSLDEQFLKIMEAVGAMGEESDKAMKSLEGLFGARMGFGLMRLAKDLPAAMAQAKRESKGYAGFMEDSAASMDRLGDSFIKFGMMWNQVVGKILMALPIDKISAAIEGWNVDKFATKLGSIFSDPGGWLVEIFQWLKAQMKALAEIFVNHIVLLADVIGEKLAIGVKKAFGMGATDGSQEGSFLQKAAGAILKAATQVTPQMKPIEFKSARMEGTMDRTLRVLERIERKGGAQFA